MSLLCSTVHLIHPQTLTIEATSLFNSGETLTTDMFRLS
jgi:hypothetical protein